MHRYQVKYGDDGEYVVRDTMFETKPIVFRSKSKSTAIAKSQKLNGFTPIDGDEQTYASQVTQANAKIGR